jgi:hypothetical protein
MRAPAMRIPVRQSIVLLVLTIVVATALSPAARASSLRSLTLKYHGVLIGSGSLDENYSGVARFQIPSTWDAIQKGRFFDLTPPAVEGCAIKVQVNNQPTLTAAGPGAQVAAALPDGLRVAALGRGSRAHGSWGIDETSPHAAPPGRRVYAIGIIHVSKHEYDRLRVVVTFSGSCSDDVVRNGPTLTALRRIVSDGSFAGHRLAR